MNRLLKAKNGMTMIEVIISIALLSVVSVPLIISFMNSLNISRLSKNQIEINAVTRTIKETVTDGFYNNLPLNDFDSDGDIDLYRDFLCDSSGVPATSGAILYRVTPKIDVPDSNYKFTILYDSANFHNPAYEDVTNVLIKIYNIDNKIVNKLKITVPF